MAQDARPVKQTALRGPGGPCPRFHGPDWYEAAAEEMAEHAAYWAGVGQDHAAAELARWAADYRAVAERLRGVRP